MIVNKGAKSMKHQPHDYRIHSRLSWLLLPLLSAVFCAGLLSAAQADDGENSSGLVEIGGGRSLYVEVQGYGSPAVVLISGKGVDASDWMQILEPNDPAHKSPSDDVATGLGTFVDSPDSVFPTVARLTRVCAYDRPDTRFDGADLSTPGTQPHSVDLDVTDLHALLLAAQVPEPYVLVAHSYGGFIAALYARRYPDSVAGLVMVDAATERLEEAMSYANLTSWDKQNRAASNQVKEQIEIIDAIERIKAAPPMPKVPTIILSADKPYRFDLLPPEAQDAIFLTFSDWLASQDLMASALGGEHIKKTNSGHHIYLYSPKLVNDAIRAVVEEVRGRR
jgi:pimeloyl-ACP methyl ester carboxylesterase